MNKLAFNNDVLMYILNEATNLTSNNYITIMCVFYYLFFINFLFAFWSSKNVSIFNINIFSCKKVISKSYINY